MKLEVYDSDGTSGDDDMGFVEVTLPAGTSRTWTDALTSNSNASISATVESVR